MTWMPKRAMLEVSLTSDLVSPEIDFEEKQSHFLEDGEQGYQKPTTRLARGSTQVSLSNSQNDRS